MKKTLASALVVTLISSSITGCSTMLNTHDALNEFNAKKDEAGNYLAKNAQKNNVLHTKKGIYVNTTPIKVSDQKSQLENIFPGNIVISSKNLLSLTEITDKITKLTGIPVNYSDPTAQSGANGQQPAKVGIDSAGSLPTELSDIPGLSLDSLYTNLNSAAGLGFPSDTPSIDASFDGKLTDFLDHVAGRMGLFWRYEPLDGRIVLFKYETKTFSLYMMPGEMQLKASLSNTSSSKSSTDGDSGSTSSSSSGQTLDMTSSIKIWSESLESIKKMITKKGIVQGNEAIGKITVTDTPLALANIERYVEEINKAMSRQVSFEVSIYDVELSNDNKVGIDWNFVWNEAAKYSIGYGAASSVASSITSGFTFSDTGNGNQSGSTSVLKALETQGKVSLRTKHQAVTINNTPVPIKVADEVTYLASSTSGSTGSSLNGAALTTELTPGKVVTGLTMTLLPRIFDSNQMMLQLALDLADLKEMATITSGGQSIQAPRVGAKSFMQRVSLKNNESLIMSGFDQNKYSVNYDSALDIPSGLGSGKKHIITVIMVRPRITEGLTGI